LNGKKNNNILKAENYVSDKPFSPKQSLFPSLVVWLGAFDTTS